MCSIFLGNLYLYLKAQIYIYIYREIYMAQAGCFFVDVLKFP